MSLESIRYDGFAESPISALSFIFRHCGVLDVRLTPQESLALILNFLLCHPDFDFFETIKFDGCPAPSRTVGCLRRVTDVSFFLTRRQRHPAFS